MSRKRMNREKVREKGRSCLFFPVCVFAPHLTIIYREWGGERGKHIGGQSPEARNSNPEFARKNKMMMMESKEQRDFHHLTSGGSEQTKGKEKIRNKIHDNHWIRAEFFLLQLK
jgi:hypothetical protein